MTEKQEVNWDSMRDVAEAVNAWANRTFPDRAPGSSLVKLNMAEIPELLTHMNEHGPDGIGPEWADCMILLLDLARIWKIDPARAIEDKMRINNGRMWTKDPATGMFQHVKLEPKVDFSSAESIRAMKRCGECENGRWYDASHGCTRKCRACNGTGVKA